MARPLLLLCLIFLMDALLVVTEADYVASSFNPQPPADYVASSFNPQPPADYVASSFNPQPPASSPSSIEVREQEAPQIRKLGKHRSKAISPSAAPGLSPSQAPHAQTKENLHFPEAVSSLGQKNATTQLQDTRMTQQHHHSFDRSVAGGGVILGGLGTAFLVAIVCYIRATRRRNTEPIGSAADVAKA